jgi:integrase
MKRKLLDGTYRDGASKVTLHDLREAMLADVQANGRKYEKRVEQCFTHLERLIGTDTTADRIEDHLDRYVKTRLSERVGGQEDEKNTRTTARGTVNRELSCLRRAYRLMVRRRRLAIMPEIELLAEHNTRTRFPSEKEIGDVIEKLPERLQGPIRFVALSGWRVGEALNLSWRSVDRKTGTIRLEASETKGRDVRTLPYADDPRLAELIEERWAETEAWQREHGQLVPWVFWCASEEGGNPVAAPNRVYSRAWAKACEKAKVADFHVHDLRRAFARSAVRAGVDEKTIMALAGWKTRSVFDRYSVRDHQDLVDGVKKLAQAALDRERSAERRKA